MLNFTELLQGKYDLKPPPVGTGRVHRISPWPEPQETDSNTASRGPKVSRADAILRNRAIVLAAIRGGGETVTAIADETGLSRSGAQGHVDALLAEKAIYRVGGERHIDGYHFRATA